MSRLPFPEEVSLADAMAFDHFTPEQKRIAVAGVAVHEWLKDRIDEETESARQAGWDEGYAKRVEETDGPIHAALDSLALVRQALAPADSRYLALGEIIADLTKLVVPA